MTDSELVMEHARLLSCATLLAGLRLEDLIPLEGPQNPLRGERLFFGEDNHAARVELARAARTFQLAAAPILARLERRPVGLSGALKGGRNG